MTLTAGGTAQTTLTIATTDLDNTGVAGALHFGLGNSGLGIRDGAANSSAQIPNPTSPMPSPLAFSLCLGIFAVGIFVRRRKTRKDRILRWVLPIFLLLLILGFGSCATQQRTYTITITGTANAFPATTQSTTVTLVVH